MSQAKVNDYFTISKGKRGRVDDFPLKKDKKLHTMEINENLNDSKTSMCNENSSKILNKIEKVEKIEIKTTETTTRITRSSKLKISSEELKQKLENFNRKLQIHKEINLELNDEAQNETKTTTNELPGYLKYHNLASKEAETTLVLPKKYALLHEIFKCTDTCVKFMHNRQEICTFMKLKNAVQNINKRNFNQENLGQIKTVYATAYLYKQEKLYIDYTNGYHLTITANIEQNAPLNESGIKVMTPGILLERLQCFKTRLLDRVKEYHEEFLKQLGRSVKNKDIKKWHPEFDLESVDDIPPSDLPQVPNELKCKTINDIKAIANDIYSTKVKSAIDSYLKEESSTQKQNLCEKYAQTVELVNNVNGINVKNLKNFNSLLERVRAKERYKEIENIVRNTDKEKRLNLLDQYVDCVKFLKSYYHSEKKTTFDIEFICNKMFDALRGNFNSVNDCETIIRKLCEDFSEWLSILKVRNIEYVKMNKSIEITQLLAKIDSLKQQSHSS